MRAKLVAAIGFAFALLFPAGAMAQQAGISACAGGTLAVTSSSANVQLSTCGPVVIVYNITSQEAFYAFGATSSAAATAQTTSTAAPIAGTYSLPGNSFVTLNISNETAAYLAAITASNTTTLRIVQGYAQP
jgi:hypothetical protein